MTPLNAPADECPVVMKKNKKQGNIKEGTMRVQRNVGNVPAIAMESRLIYNVLFIFYLKQIT